MINLYLFSAPWRTSEGCGTVSMVKRTDPTDRCWLMLHNYLTAIAFIAAARKLPVALSMQSLVNGGLGSRENLVLITIAC
jgi:hypothetical protein